MEETIKVCVFCGELVDEENNVCDNCSTSGVAYKIEDYNE